MELSPATASQLARMIRDWRSAQPEGLALDHTHDWPDWTPPPHFPFTLFELQEDLVVGGAAAAWPGVFADTYWQRDEGDEENDFTIEVHDGLGMFSGKAGTTGEDPVQGGLGIAISVTPEENTTGDYWLIVGMQRLGRMCSALTTAAVAKTDTTFTVDHVAPVAADEQSPVAEETDTIIVDNSVAKRGTKTGESVYVPLYIWITDCTPAGESVGHAIFMQSSCKADQ